MRSDSLNQLFVTLLFESGLLVLQLVLWDCLSKYHYISALRTFSTHLLFWQVSHAGRLFVMRNHCSYLVQPGVYGNRIICLIDSFCLTGGDHLWYPYILRIFIPTWFVVYRIWVLCVWCKNCQIYIPPHHSAFTTYQSLQMTSLKM